MSGPSRRGLTERVPRIASCEPCRLSKLACDHRRPVCSRCINRDIINDCVYRKNPFKRIRSIRSSQPSSNPRPRLAFEPPPAGDIAPPTFQVKLYPDPGFQGSSSLKTVLDNLGEHPSFHGSLDPHRTSQRSSPIEEREPSRGAVLLINGSAMIEEGVQLLDLFLASIMDNSFERIFFEWRGNGLDSHLGAFLVQPFMHTIADEIAQLQQCANWRSGLLALSQRLFEKGNHPVQIHGSMSFQEFVDQYTGPNLRWETVGVILTLAGIAATEIRVPHAVCDTEQERQALRMNMIHFSNKCVSFCESFDMLNDVQIIFLYQHFLLHSVFYGDQSFKTWRRLNDATSALLAAGLHEKIQEGSNLPFFLVEIRKRIFARLYGTDISLATFLGRPPRLSKRFCCIHYPLDLDEDTYPLAGEDLERELGSFDQNGWNTQGQIRKGAVLRWSMVTSTIREDTLEVLLGRDMTDVQQCICGLRTKIKDTWNSLPRFLAVSSSHDLWLGRQHRHEAESLHLIRLFYLQTVFLIEWAAWRHGVEPNSLFQAASELLAWVNEALVRREHLFKLGFISLAWRVATCALPAAGALALYLLQPSSRIWFKHHLDATSRRHTVENISVLIAHIDILHSPNDGNYQLFCQAKRSLQSVMDMILHPSSEQPSQQLETPSTGISNPLPAVDWVVSDHCGFDGDFWFGLPDRLLSFPAPNDNMSA